MNADSSVRLLPDSFVWIRRRDSATTFAPSTALLAGFPNAPTTAQALPTPPDRGMTLGFAGTSDPAELASIQPFQVQSISAFDIAGQRWLTYVPGAPTAVSSLTPATLAADSVVVCPQPRAQGRRT